MRMLQLRSELNLAAETVEHHFSRQLGREDLKDYFPAEGNLVGEEDTGHAAAAKLSFDRVAGTKSGL